VFNESNGRSESERPITFGAATITMILRPLALDL